jgi:hypothetical protein
MGAYGAVIDLTGMYGKLAKLRDKRQTPGKRYELALVLLLVVLAKYECQPVLCRVSLHQGWSLLNAY